MIDISLLDPSKGICFASYGAGQQSASVLALLTDPNRRAVYDEYVGDRNLIIFHADTMDERSETIAFRAWTAAYCTDRKLLYKTIDPSLGFHRGGWIGGLQGQWLKSSGISSVAFPSTCSDSLKIAPLYEAVADVMRRLYGFKSGRKAEFYQYVEHFGEKLQVLIGFGRGEENRAGLPTASASGQLDLIELFGDVVQPSESSGRIWMDRCVQKRYPLIEGIGFEELTEQLGHPGMRGFDRSDCIHYLAMRDFPRVWPSMCERCHWSSKSQVEALRRFQPQKLEEWKRFEAVKIEAWKERCEASGARNSYVKGSIPLAEFERQAHEEFGHFSDEDLLAHNFSHGHEVKSRH